MGTDRVTATVVDPPCVMWCPVHGDWGLFPELHWPTFRLRVSIDDWSVELPGYVICGYMTKLEAMDNGVMEYAKPSRYHEGRVWVSAPSDATSLGLPKVEYSDDIPVRHVRGLGIVQLRAFDGQVVTIPDRIVRAFSSPGELASLLGEAIEEAAPVVPEPELDSPDLVVPGPVD